MEGVPVGEVVVEGVPAGVVAIGPSVPPVGLAASTRMATAVDGAAFVPSVAVKEIASSPAYPAAGR